MGPAAAEDHRARTSTDTSSRTCRRCTTRCAAARTCPASRGPGSRDSGEARRQHLDLDLAADRRGPGRARAEAARLGVRHRRAPGRAARRLDAVARRRGAGRARPGGLDGDRDGAGARAVWRRRADGRGRPRRSCGNAWTSPPRSGPAPSPAPSTPRRAGPGACRRTSGGRSTPRCARGSRRSCDHAARCGVQVAVEPLVRYETSLINTVEQALEAIDGLPGPAACSSTPTTPTSRRSRSATRSALAGDKLVPRPRVGQRPRRAGRRPRATWGEVRDALREIGYDGDRGDRVVHRRERDDRDRRLDLAAAGGVAGRDRRRRAGVPARAVGLTAHRVSVRVGLPPVREVLDAHPLGAIGVRPDPAGNVRRARPRPSRLGDARRACCGSRSGSRSSSRRCSRSGPCCSTARRRSRGSRSSSRSSAARSRHAACSRGAGVRTAAAGR